MLNEKKLREINNNKKAEILFVEAFWTDGIMCPYCGCLKIYDLSTGNKKCSECKRKWGLKAGTLFHRSHLSYLQILKYIYYRCVLGKSFCKSSSLVGVTLRSGIKIDKKISQYIKNKEIWKGKKNKSIAQLTKENELVEVYDSIYKAKKHTGINHICCAITKKRKTAGGYKWMSLGEFESLV
ncbi:MAG: transposase [Mycoplasma sp.]|nr:transposase [Mycoplasma sp.]